MTSGKLTIYFLLRRYCKRCVDVGVGAQIKVCNWWVVLWNTHDYQPACSSWTPQLNLPSNHHGGLLALDEFEQLTIHFQPSSGRFTFASWERHCRIALPSSNHCRGGAAFWPSAMGETFWWTVRGVDDGMMSLSYESMLSYRRFWIFSIQICERTCCDLCNSKKAVRLKLSCPYVWGVLVTVISSIQYEGRVIN